MGNRAAQALIVCVCILSAMGLLMVFDTTAAEVLERRMPVSTHYAFCRQLVYVGIGLVAAWGVWKIGYRPIVASSGILLFFLTLLLILTFVPKVGQQINGAHRWISVFGVSFQPSEFVKYAIPLYYVHKMVSLEGMVSWRSFVRRLSVIAIPMALILIEPDNGTVAIILFTLLILFILTKLPWMYWGLPLLVLTLCGVGAALHMPHVAHRLQAYAHPEQDIRGKGHQPYQAKIAAGSGGLLGRGLAESVQKFDYLPEARSDYIAAIYAEEMGFLGMLGLIVLYVLIGASGFCLATQAESIEGFYLAAIFTFLICFQAFLNLGVVSGLLPSKGTNLPFFSQGGSSFLSHAMGISFILSVARKRVCLGS